MTRLASIVIVTIFGGGAVACLVPTFDGMSGGAAGTSESRPPATPASSEIASDASAEASASDSGSGGAGSASDASPGSTGTFSCGSSERCSIGTQTCCEVFASVNPVCRPAASPGACEGTLPCGDAADCGAGRQCCYDTSNGKGRGTCETSCPASSYTICDKNKPTCPSGKQCSGIYFGLPYCM